MLNTNPKLSMEQVGKLRIMIGEIAKKLEATSVLVNNLKVDLLSDPQNRATEMQDHLMRITTLNYQHIYLTCILNPEFAVRMDKAMNAAEKEVTDACLAAGVNPDEYFYGLMSTNPEKETPNAAANP